MHVFPHIVSAETILFWTWKIKGHSNTCAETIWGYTVYEIFKILQIQKRKVSAETLISFSSCKQPIRIPNFDNNFFVYLFTFWVLIPGKSFELRLKYIKKRPI